MDIRYEILRTLRESRDSISGQELSRQLGITRTAVWKHIRALEEEGYEIEAVNRKGYRLAGVPDTIAAREVQSRLETKRMGKEICYFSTIGSTNQYAKKIAEEGAADGTLVIADEQTDGRGRSGRHWVTPPAEVKPTRKRSDIRIIASALEETDGDVCYTGEITVESDRANYNVDLGFVSRRKGVLPDGYGQGKTQNWQK